MLVVHSAAVISSEIAHERNGAFGRRWRLCSDRSCVAADHLFDDAELEHSFQLAELEHRCTWLGAECGRVATEHGFGFDAETFVVSELVRAAQDREVDAATLLEYFEREGFIRRAVAGIEAEL